jgi:hypothetical protein
MRCCPVIAIERRLDADIRFGAEQFCEQLRTLNLKLSAIKKAASAMRLASHASDQELFLTRLLRVALPGSFASCGLIPGGKPVFSTGFTMALSFDFNSRCLAFGDLFDMTTSVKSFR